MTPIYHKHNSLFCVIVKILLVSLFCARSLFGSLAFAAELTQKELRLVSVVPVLHALNLEILKNTEVLAEYLPPKRLPVSRVSNWIKRKGKETMQAFGSYTSVVTIESIRPDLAIYPLVRTGNIRIVPVDAANELSPSGSKVTLPNSAAAHKAFFWLDMNNLITMSQIITRDLSNLWPEQASQFKENQRHLQNKINEFVIKRDELLLESDRYHLCVTDQKLLPLAVSLNMPVTLEENFCDSESSITLTRSAKKEHSAPGKWAVNTLEKPFKAGLLQWLEVNLSGLQTAVQ